MMDKKVERIYRDIAKHKQIILSLEKELADRTKTEAAKQQIVLQLFARIRFDDFGVASHLAVLSEALKPIHKVATPADVGRALDSLMGLTAAHQWGEVSLEKRRANNSRASARYRFVVRTPEPPAPPAEPAQPSPLTLEFGIGHRGAAAGQPPGGGAASVDGARRFPPSASAPPARAR